MKHIFSILFAFLLAQVGWSQSIFADGDWYKIATTEVGIYKLDKTYLENIGLDVSIPQNIAVYGGDGRALEQQNSSTRHTEPQEIPTLLVDTGVIDFAIYFYSEGIETISIGGDNHFKSHLNIYTDTLYYYLRIKEEEAVHLEERSIDNNDSTSSEVIIFEHFETDEVNLFSSGRDWLSYKMSNFNLNQTFNHPLIDPQSNLLFSYQLVGISSRNSIYFDVSVENTLLESKRVAISNQGYGVKAREATNTKTVPLQLLDDSLLIDFHLDNKGDENASGYIDYYSIEYKTEGSSVSTNQRFYSFGTPKTIWKNKEEEQQLLWARNIETNSQYLVQKNSVGDSVNYSISSDSLEMLFVDIHEVNRIPVFLEQIENKDILALDTDPTMLIVYHKKLIHEVLAFQAYKNSIGVTTKIAEVGDILDLFANGKKDVSGIRNYVKYMYENSTELKYLLLFGDCSYDYKDRQTGNTNMVPTYQSYQSYHNVQTYSSDDYFGFLDADEGVWDEKIDGDQLLDLAVGRFPARNTEEAQVIVNKIIAYETKNKGNWKNKALFVADDEDQAMHVEQSKTLIEIVKEIAPFTHISTNFVDDYEHATNDVSFAKEKLIDFINEGAMFVNFVGHGSEYIWTSEEILSVQDIKNLKNKNNLPIFITATCEFGRFDDPKVKSGGEELLMNENGAIALVTTTRPVYSASNFTISKTFYNEAFKRNEDSTFRSLGEVFRATKNNSLTGIYNRNFSLLGDPSMKINLASSKIRLDSVDHQAIQSYNDTIRPGQNVTFAGSVLTPIGDLDDLYNGTVELTIYEPTTTTKTVGNGGQLTVAYEKGTAVIYSARGQAVDGKFTITVSLPMESSNKIGTSQVTFYSYDSTYKEAYGYSKLNTGGNAIEIDSNEVPEISVSFSQEDLENGFGQQMTLNINVADDFGLMLTNGIIGKENRIIVNGNQSEPILLNDLFVLENGASNKASCEVTISGLYNGTNTFEVLVWDMHGERGSYVFETETTLSAGAPLKQNSYTTWHPFEVKMFMDPNDSSGVVIIGFENNYKTNELTIYPNPVKSDINFTLIGALQFEIMDELGTVQDRGKLQDLETKISTENLAPGIYHLRLVYDDKVLVESFYKE